MDDISKELDILQGNIQDEVLKWHRTLYLTGRVDAADAVAFALQLVNEQFADIKKAESEGEDATNSIKTVTNAKEAETYPINEDISKGFEEFTKMMFKQGQEESEAKFVINQKYSPVDFCEYAKCPKCGETVSGFSIASPDVCDEECPKCGQKLKWWC